jgi:branched-chain amino acid transport system permease protein
VFDFLVHILVVATIYAVLAVSLDLQAGTAGLMNFGQIAFFGIGGYAAALVAQAGGSPVLGIPCGIVLAVGAGALVGRLGRNLEAEYWAIATLGLAEIVRIVAINEGWLTGGAEGIGGPIGLFPNLRGPAHGLAFLGLSAAGLAVCYALVQTLTNRQFGRVLRLLREQPDLAVSFGYDVVSFKVRAMMVGAPVAALAGALMTYYIAYISPADLASFGTFLVWTIIIIGGVGNHRGAVLGAFIVQFIYTGALFLKDVVGIPSELAGSLRMLMVGCLLLTFLMIKSGGLLPEKLRKIHAEN